MNDKNNCEVVQFQLNLLVKALLKDAPLNYTNTGINFNTSCLDNMLELIAPEIYNKKFDELLLAERKRTEEDEGLITKATKSRPTRPDPF